MNPILKKMTWREGLNIRVWNTPEELMPLIQVWKEEGLLKELDKADFYLVFVQTKEEVKQCSSSILSLISGDEQVWMAYPKGTSKRYKSEINRDSGWDSLRENGHEPVRQIAINEDWSALRFRNIRFIKKMIRKSSPKDEK